MAAPARLRTGSHSVSSFNDSLVYQDSRVRIPGQITKEDGGGEWLPRRGGARASGFRFFKLSYDRSDPSKTVKRHVVKEQQPDGTWVVVHDEHEEYTAKRRPK